MRFRIVVVDIALSAHHRRLLILAAIVGSVSMTAPNAQAKPHVFGDGDTLVKEDLNGLAVVTNAKNGKQWSLGAVWCKTTDFTTGKLDATNGYTAGKTLCESTCGTPSAHMCTPEETIRSVQLGMGPFAGWVASGVVAPRVDATGVGSMNDCRGFTSDDPNLGGLYWNYTLPVSTFCSNAGVGVLCCD